MKKPPQTKHQVLDRYRLPVPVAAKDITAVERRLNFERLLSITAVDANTVTIQTTDAGMALLLGK